MSNIEDIKFIEEMIKEYKTFGDLHNPDYEDTDRIYKALENVLERIKELEEENAILREANNITKDLTKEVKIEDITQIMNKSYEEFMSQFIAKQKVKKGLERIEDYFYRLNGPDEDIEYIRNIKKELLEEK